ncbi:hypothetical protein ACSNOI_24510 [Actinomadura kijaniata]|uniref:hypothetical protein n=1 Tax=Actinomadura kijaniata TaxID=46161 RepID=UPI003F19CF33
MTSQPDLSRAVSLITGLIRAYELHADANPADPQTLRQDADVARSIRDGLLRIMGTDIKEVDPHGGFSREWTASIGMLTRGDGSWKEPPSRDPHLTLEEIEAQDRRR